MPRYEYRPITWFEECLRNQKAYIDNKRAEAERLAAHIRNSQEEYDHLAAAVAKAKAEGKFEMLRPPPRKVR